MADPTPGLMAALRASLEQARAARRRDASTPDPTAAEIEAGARALYDHEYRTADEPIWVMLPTADQHSYREAVAAVLRAVLPDHDARREAEIRAKVADELREQAGREQTGSVDQVVMLHAAEIAHATPPKEDHHG